MKPLIVLTLLLVIAINSQSQPVTVVDYKTKTTAHAADRTAILDSFRTKLNKQWKQQFEFVVKYLKVAGNYACFMGGVERKDGKEIKFPADGEYDCCHAEALLEKKNGKWEVLEGAAFSTDVWYDGINQRYPQIPLALFPQDAGWVR